MNQRNNNLDLLRIIACFAVVLMHTTAVWINKSELGLFDPLCIINKISSIYIVFIPLSGAMLLGNNKNVWYNQFLKKRFSKIGYPLLFSTIFYAIFSTMVSDVNWKGAIVSILIGKPFYHLWFMYMLIGLYFVSPLLISLKQQIGEKMFFKIGVLLTCLSIPIDYFSELFWVIKFVPYIGYFMLGHSLMIYRKQHLKFISLSLFFVSIIMAFVGEYILKLANVPLSLFADFSPFIIIAVLSLMGFFINSEPIIKSDISAISLYTFQAYLIHAAIIKLFPNISYFTPLQHSLFMAICVFIMSLFYGYVVEVFFKEKINKLIQI